MKTNPSAPQHGVALVIVLVFVVLLSVFILSFFTNSQNELSAAQSFSGEISAHQLAETANALVMGQIREATAQKNVAWASQPGMIRTWGNEDGTASEKALAFYKLYSSDDMIVGRKEFDAFRAKFNDPKMIGAEIPIDQDPQGTTGWDSQPALFTDLNSPITLAEPAKDGSSVVKFPIIDGHDIKEITPPSVPANPSSAGQFQPVWSYDGLNERRERTSDGVADIEGFAIEKNTVKYEVPTEENPLSPTNTPVPMPVRWMYVLRDGSLTVPTASKEDKSTKLPTIAEWADGAARKPTKTNPIVGRIGFWADDDSSKVNINTAGGFNYRDIDRAAYRRERDFAGSYWDQPRTYTRFDYGDANDDGRNGEDGSVNVGGLSITQPIAREYQRYPGHPATTSIGLLFKDILNSEQLYSILPRLNNRGTRGGTERLYADNSDIDAEEGIDEQDYTRPLPLKRDRIFASVDEFLFGGRFRTEDPFRPLNDLQLMTDPKLIDRRLGNRTYNDQLKPGEEAITPEVLEKMRFFLTAHSRAPELNLFGRPRITIWPTYPDDENDPSTIPTSVVDKKNGRLNASDRLLEFCSTIGPRVRDDGSEIPKRETKLFQFQRNDPYSPTNDWDGTGVTPRRVSMPQTPDGGTRNQFIFRYLKELTSQRVPGFAGGSFFDKYQQLDRDQILTSIFDYMRCVNMRDSTRDKYLAVIPKNPTKAEWKKVEPFKFAPLGIVIPVAIQEGSATTRGFGRFPIFSEATLVLYHAGYLNNKYFPGKIYKTLDGLKNNAGVLVKEGLNDALNSNNDSKGDRSKDANDNKRWDRREGVTHNVVRAFLIFEAFNPMMGYAPTRALNQKSEDRVCFIVEVDGLNKIDIRGAEGSEVIPGPERGLQFPPTANNLFVFSSGNTYHGRNLGGSEGWLHMLRGSWGNAAPTSTQSDTNNNAPVRLVPNKWGTRPPVAGSNPPSAHWYDFQSRGSVAVKAPEVPEPMPEDGAGFKATDNAHPYFKYLRNPDLGQKLELVGGELSVRMRFGDVAINGQGKLTTNPPTIFSMKVKFPNARVPMPTDHVWMHDPGGFAVDRWSADAPDSSKWAVEVYDTNVEGVKSFGGRLLAPLFGREDNLTGVLDNSYLGGWQSGGCFAASSSNETGNKPPGWNHTNRWRQLIQPGDTVRSVVLGVNGDDPRIVSINPENAEKFYSPHPLYGDKPDTPLVRHAQTLRTAVGVPQFAVSGTDRTVYGAGSDLPFGRMAEIGTRTYPSNGWPDLPPGINGVKMSFGNPTTTGRPGDFDTGLGNLPDGAYVGKSDEGNPVFRRRERYLGTDNQWHEYWVYPHPYFNYDYEETFDTFFTPNRQTPSAVVFGSLPIGKNGHWTTLAFSPVSACETSDASGRAVHPGRKANFVRDHLLLDLFNMPIVEPYAISEPLSTAGKINLNYPMMPFTNIERSTAFRAALHSVRVSAFPVDHVSTYKTSAAYNSNYNYRYMVDRNMTVRAFKDFFDQFKKDSDLGLFKSASEICDRGIYPKIATQPEGGAPADPVTAVRYTSSRFNADPDFHLKTSFWRTNALTGDNMREKPYSDLYPRITTKSNTYTVHVRAQSLRQTPQSAEQGIWDEKRDRVIGEYRGSSTIERFIDPEDGRFDPKNAAIDSRDKIDVDKDSLEGAYRFRVISTRRFVP